MPCRVVLGQIIRHVAQRRNILRGRGPLSASTSWRRQSIAVRSPSLLASVSLVANVEPVARLAFQPKAIRRRILSPFQYICIYIYTSLPEQRLLLSSQGLQHD